MSRRKTGNNQYLKQRNQTVILDLIRVYKQKSKTELAELTGLSPTAVGVITSCLLKDGYIHEAGTGDSKGGRRPILLALKPHSYYAIGVDVDVMYAKILLVDITGNIIEEKTQSVPKNATAKLTIAQIEQGILQMLAQKNIRIQKVLGIGISIPGLVNHKNRQVVLAPNLGWHNVDVYAHMKQFSDIPIYIENEAMASAICENWVGLCQGVEHFICINIQSGIGAGIFVNGNIYRGVGGSAGEVGHIVVDETGPRCGCGNYGCLETLASTYHMVQEAKKRVRQGIVSCLNDVEALACISIETIVDAARAGDQAAYHILKEAARYLGIALSNMINTLNPSKIVIGKEFVKYADLVLEDVYNIVQAKTLHFPTSNVEIIASKIGDKASALGAAIIPLKVLFGR